ncbi:hypothetical protein PHLGIDRAFT_178064 [Phlebiopsis gigantea 11061_1 CR5-6]|uniref:Uncharacterized protein n=1 Tax=Phlebiopsis gigantea (strain 11061_1 CR5-6) TaxID=745531 RepID=A0A0C3S473_PHLG1|nr:hypothetical protein PHLGIDRAFT_178064 [Phlebiopsis gigantea 11061_1 CR5-6]
MLFEDADTPPEPFMLPGLDTPIVPSLNPSLLPPPGALPSKGRNRSRSAASSGEPDEDVLTAKQPTFQFPPRSATPRTTRKLTLTDDSYDEDGFSASERHPPLGPGIPSGRSPSRQSSRQPSPLSSPLFMSTSLDDDVQDVVVPPVENSPAPQKDGPPPIVFSASSPDTPNAPPARPILNRGRSQSSAVDSPPGSTADRDWSFPSPSTFQFPPPGFSQLSTPPLASPITWTHNRVSPTHSSVSTISTVSRTSHQFTHSLDASVVPRRSQGFGSMPTPPPVTRSRSAAPFGEPGLYATPSHDPETVMLQSVPKKPSMTRLASLPVMETIQTPTKPFTFGRPERSGSVDTAPPLPGLRDVLRVMQ